ncbi:Aldose 1-epimerase [Pleurostoma richardsiae]|uniref:Aldose 1-epimerase n=1 Tax=Pleurostoma richardsiae TaxID=41990 RepID=A0AA38RUC8_9PEZI|nr:Aldose 1-epimerase [Pleurostoma richardsiae]
MADAPISFIPFGAILQSFVVDGTNIVQGFPSADLYRTHNSPFFGATVGRVANRIKNAKIDALNGRAYALAANNGPNTLHGGAVGWDKRDWAGPAPVGTRQIPGVEGLQGGESVQFRLASADGEEGFPGALDVKTTYTAGTQAVGGKKVTVLGIEYEAQLVGGADETVINMTNHSYFNLTGNPTIEGTQVELVTNDYLPVDSTGIPTEGPKPFSKVEGKKPFILGAEEPDVDDCFVVNKDAASVPIDTRGLPLTKLVSASHPDSKIHLEVWSTEPAFQFYTGKYIDVPAVGGAPARGPRSGFCVEPSRYVNACNVPEWKNQMLLKKGQTYGARIVYRAWKE